MLRGCSTSNQWLSLINDNENERDYLSHVLYKSQLNKAIIHSEV